ncbi:MAG: hypothetical protein Q7U82_14500, partial [Gammaproteobacteria bacterium]|nr:hypothetical protein [Gammaproteobacteria bacterium]
MTAENSDGLILCKELCCTKFVPVSTVGREVQFRRKQRRIRRREGAVHERVIAFASTVFTSRRPEVTILNTHRCAV